MKIFESRPVLLSINFFVAVLIIIITGATAFADNSFTIERPEFLDVADKLTKDIIQMKDETKQILDEIDKRSDAIGNIDETLDSTADPGKKMALQAQRNKLKKTEIKLRKKGVKIVKGRMSQAMDYLDLMKGDLQNYNDASSTPVLPEVVNGYNNYCKTSAEMVAQCLGLDKVDPRLLRLMELLDRKFERSIQTSSFLDDCICKISDFQKEIDLLLAELDVTQEGLEIDEQGIDMADHGLALVATLAGINDGMKTIGSVLNKAEGHYPTELITPLPKRLIQRVRTDSQKGRFKEWLKGKAFILKK